VEAEAGEHHAETTQLDRDVWASRQLAQARPPMSEHLVALVRIAADPEPAADVIEYDRRVGEGARERGQLRELRVVEPGVETEAARTQLGKAAAERVSAHGAGGRRRGEAGPERLFARREVADAAKISAGGGDMRLEHLVDGVPKREVGEADDAGADLGPRASPLRLIGDGADEFGLADRPQRLRTAVAVRPAALQIDGGDDVMATASVRQQLIKEIGLAVPIPEVMVRINDRQRGVDDFLVHRGQPVWPRDGVAELLDLARRHRSGRDEGFSAENRRPVHARALARVARRQGIQRPAERLLARKRGELVGMGLLDKVMGLFDGCGHQFPRFISGLYMRGRYLTSQPSINCLYFAYADGQPNIRPTRSCKALPNLARIAESSSNAPIAFERPWVSP